MKYFVKNFTLRLATVRSTEGQVNICVQNSISSFDLTFNILPKQHCSRHALSVCQSVRPPVLCQPFTRKRYIVQRSNFHERLPTWGVTCGESLRSKVTDQGHWSGNVKSLVHIFAKNASIHVKLKPRWHNSIPHVSSNTMQQRKCVLSEVIGRQYSKRWLSCIMCWVVLLRVVV